MEAIERNLVVKGSREECSSKSSLCFNMGSTSKHLLHWQEEVTEGRMKINKMYLGWGDY